MAPKFVCTTLLLLLTFNSTSAHSQLNGWVKSIDGSPIPFADVEIRTGDASIRSRADSLGHFRAHSVPENARVTLVVKQLGFAPRTVPDVPTSQDVTVILVPAPISLTPIAASSSHPCPHAPDPRAREIWERARRNYSDETAQRSVSTRQLIVEREAVAEADIGQMPPVQAYRPAGYSFAGASSIPRNGLHLDVNVLIRDEGYVRRTHLSEPKWRIIPLDARHSHHFFSAEFGNRHTFAIVQDSDSYLLSYCPAKRHPPAIEGTLLISLEYRALAADWTYDPRFIGIRAGGSLLFLEVHTAGDRLPHLMPATSRAWQESERWKGRFSERINVFLGWRVRLGSSLNGG